MSDHDQHSSFIKTPQQLLVVLVLSFVVPIVGIILLVKLVTSHQTADPNAITAEAIAARIAPVGRVEFGSASGGGGAARSAEEVVKTVCAACHQAGVANAPKIGDKAAWAPHIKHSLQDLVATVIKGKGAMPPRGGNATLTDDEIARAVVLMANQSGGSFKEPAAKPAAKDGAATPAAPQTASAAPAKPGAADGKAVYDKACVACHATGLANAPKLGDKAAWSPRLAQGMDALLQSVIKGKGAMPPKAGNPALSDAELRAGVDFMVSQSK